MLLVCIKSHQSSQIQTYIYESAFISCLSPCLWWSFCFCLLLLYYVHPPDVLRLPAPPTRPTCSPLPVSSSFTITGTSTPTYTPFPFLFSFYSAYPCRVKTQSQSHIHNFHIYVGGRRRKPTGHRENMNSAPIKALDLAIKPRPFCLKTAPVCHPVTHLPPCIYTSQLLVTKLFSVATSCLPLVHLSTHNPGLHCNFPLKVTPLQQPACVSTLGSSPSVLLPPAVTTWKCSRCLMLHFVNAYLKFILTNHRH